MSLVYNKKDQKDINRIRDLQVLKPLLLNIQEQEKAVVSKMKKKENIKIYCALHYKRRLIH